MASTSAESVNASASQAGQSVSNASSGLWDRVSHWASEHKAVVYTAAGATLVVTGVGAVYYFSDPSRGGDDSEQKKSKKERRKAKKEAEEAASRVAATKAIVEEEEELPEVDESTVASLSERERKDSAAKLKAAGNKAYGSKDYNRAIELYGKAILCKPDPVFYSNRAACYSALSNWEKVIEDTTAALALDPEYVKALNRRANAYEQSGQNNEALLDYTASCIIDAFRNESSAQSVERLLKKVAEAKAKIKMANKIKKLPSPIFVSNYLQSFRPKPTPPGLEDDVDVEVESGKGQLRKGLIATTKKTAEGYEEASNAFEHALELGDLGDHEAFAYNQRGTFRYLKGLGQEALEDVTKSIDIVPSFTQSYIKRASMHLEQGHRDEAAKDFEKAIEVNEDDPDIYYHRAQLNFVLGEFKEASKDYQKSIDLDKDFLFSHIQLGVTQYKMGSVASSMSTFRRCRKNFPRVPDVFNYYGELLLDQQKYQEALEQFEQAIDLEKSTKPMAMNVLPLVNKSLTIFQWQQNFEDARELCEKALKIDPECDMAVATMAQLLLQQGKVPEALKYFEQASELSRNEAEAVNALSYAEATRTQLEVQEKYPKLAERLQAGAMGTAVPGLR